MERMARRTGSSGAKTAQEVRRAALALFAEHGYAAVSMRQIAASVGVQAGALYLYTPDKQSLLADIMTEHMEAILAAWQAWPKPAAGDVRGMFDAFVRFHIRFHLERGAEVFISDMELRNLAPENFARVEAMRRRYEAVLTGILTQGRRAGVFAVADPKLATFALIAMLTGVNTWYRPGGRLGVEEVEAVYLAMARAMVGAGRVLAAAG
ncbi:TetR/AcrR family transcriptional regulator [soil metagenome]